MKNPATYKRKDILNAFRPNVEIEDPSIFAGRKNEVLKLVDSLQTDGSCPIIFGSRGTGKSSLANQIKKIASGEIELLNILGYPNFALSKNERFKVFYIKCSERTKTSEDVFEQCMHDTIKATDTIKVETLQQSTKKINLKFIEIQDKKDFVSNQIGCLSKQKIETQFLSIAYDMIDKQKLKLLFIIDEIDRVKDTTGLAAFLKNNSSSTLKFLLVGIGQTVSSLIADHKSIQMKLDPVKLDAMEHSDLSSIIDKVVYKLHQKMTPIEFLESAKEYVVRLSAGFPWYVHTIGHHALLEAYERNGNKIVVDHSDVEKGKRKVLEDRLMFEFQELYNKIVCESRNREIFLRLLARYNGEVIPISEIYSLAKQLNVKNPYIYKKQLMNNKFFEVLKGPGIHESKTIMFSDQLFKQYINICDSYHNRVKFDIEVLWTTTFQMERI